MAEKKPFREHLKKHLITVILTAVVLFLLQEWFSGLKNGMAELKDSIEKGTESRQELSQSLNQLKWQIDDIDEDFLNQLNDHETRIRDLEKK